MKYPVIQPRLVVMTQRQGRVIRTCRTNHGNIATINPEMTKVKPGRIKPPNSHPQVVAMIQKNQNAQSKERILLITNSSSAFYRAGKQAAHEVALQGKE